MPDSNTDDRPPPETAAALELARGRPASFMAWQATATRHSPLEDAQGILTGAVLATLAIALLSHLGLLTSGVAGLALIVSYATGLNVGLAFFLINLPFYALAALRMGWAFTIKTVLAVSLLSVMTAFQPRVFTFGTVDPLVGSVIAGLLLGFALLAAFRHRASFGGVGILAIYMQDRYGWRAGITQLVLDLAILGSAFAFVDARAVLYSVVGAVVLNAFLAINHRVDRYIAR